MTVGIIMGSKSDWPTMQHAAEMLDRFGIDYETKVVSAHRTPQLLADYASTAAETWDQSYHCRCWRCSTPTGYGGSIHKSACTWRSSKIKNAKWRGLIAVNLPNA